MTEWKANLSQSSKVFRHLSIFNTYVSPLLMWQYSAIEAKELLPALAENRSLEMQIIFQCRIFTYVFCDSVYCVQVWCRENNLKTLVNYFWERNNHVDGFNTLIGNVIFTSQGPAPMVSATAHISDSFTVIFPLRYWLHFSFPKINRFATRRRPS